MVDYYYTIDEEKSAEIKVKGSVFIATIIPVNSKEIAIEKWKELKAKYYDATHNCFAYRIGAGGEEFRYSDDGEPNGSAGKPIMFMLEKYEIGDVLLNVTRYFGGTKLGVGGLVRAYSDSAEEVLKQIDKKIIHITDKVSVRCSYAEISLMKRLINEIAVSFDEEYTDDVVFNINIHRSKSHKFAENVYNLTNGKVEISINTQELKWK